MPDVAGVSIGRIDFGKGNHADLVGGERVAVIIPGDGQTYGDDVPLETRVGKGATLYNGHEELESFTSRAEAVAAAKQAVELLADGKHSDLGAVTGASILVTKSGSTYELHLVQFDPKGSDVALWDASTTGPAVGYLDLLNDKIDIAAVVTSPDGDEAPNLLALSTGDGDAVAGSGAIDDARPTAEDLAGPAPAVTNEAPSQSQSSVPNVPAAGSAPGATAASTDSDSGSGAFGSFLKGAGKVALGAGGLALTYGVTKRMRGRGPATTAVATAAAATAGAVALDRFFPELKVGDVKVDGRMVAAGLGAGAALFGVAQLGRSGLAYKGMDYIKLHSAKRLAAGAAGAALGAMVLGPMMSGFLGSNKVATASA